MNSNTSQSPLRSDFAITHRGRFTASEVHKLITPTWKIASNETSRGYILQKAIEKEFNYIPDISSKSLDHGTEYEPLAFAKFNEVMAEHFIEARYTPFILIDENSGATPDGIVSDGSCLQIKCPYNTLNFFKLKLSGEIIHEYQVQMQMEMMAAKSDKCYFFNYVVVDGVEFYHLQTLYANQQQQDIITQAIAQAVEQRDETIAKLLTVQAPVTL